MQGSTCQLNSQLLYFIIMGKQMEEEQSERVMKALEDIYYFAT